MSLSQTALSKTKELVSYVIEDCQRHRRYTHQAQSVVLHTRVKLDDRYYSIPELTLRLRDTKHQFGAYNVLLSYFCHELVGVNTHLPVAKEIVDDLSIEEVGTALKSFDAEYFTHFIHTMFSDDSVCTECIRHLSVLYMKTVLEYSQTYLDIDMPAHHHIERDYVLGEWAAKALFNHETPFSKKKSVHCRITHIVYTSLMQETNFCAELARHYNEASRDILMHVGAPPVGSYKDLCALDFVLRHSGYIDHPYRRLYWVVAYLVICHSMLIHKHQVAKKDLSSLIFPSRRKSPVKFYFTTLNQKDFVF